MDSFTITELVTRAIKYFLEGLAVALATFIIPMKKPSVEEVLAVAIVAAVTFALLDLMAPSIGLTARRVPGSASAPTLLGSLGFKLRLYPSGNGFSYAESRFPRV